MKCQDKLWEASCLRQLSLCVSGAGMLYFFIFNNQQLIVNLASASKYSGALGSLIIILLAATLYGNAVSIILRYTLEKAIECRRSGKE
ncbi:MAG: hypothetical protein ACOY4I_05880 [Bacillota bacterium]